MRFGEKLSFLRKQRGMTQMELAEKLDISRQAVSRWEQGISEPSTENLVSIGKLFSISVDALINEDVQLQAESAMQVLLAEEKETIEKHKKDSITKIIVIVSLSIAVVLAMWIGLRKGRKNPAPMEDFDKDIINVSETVFLPID